MKTLLTSIAITFVSLNVFGQDNLAPDLKAPRNDNFILDSFYNWAWDTTALEWKNNNRTLYTTNSDQEVTSEISSIWYDMNHWRKYELITRTFDANHNPIKEITQFWDGTAWVNNWEYVYTYDSDNNQTVSLFLTWDSIAWVNSFQQVFTYDNQHNQLTRTSQHWTGTDWADGTRQLNTYDANNSLTLRLFQNYTTGWNDVARSLYTYDANHDLDTSVYQKWNFNAWVDDYRNIYDFDAHHNRIFILSQLAVGINFWVDQEKYEYTYDQYDNITHLIYMKYEGNAWNNIYQYNLINDGPNRVTEVYQTWEDEWVNADSAQYYYTEITPVRDFFNHLEMSIAPNPTSDFLFVEYPEPIDGTVAIYSVSGTKLLEFKSNNEQTFLLNVSTFPPGVYFVALQVGHQVLTKGFEKF